VASITVTPPPVKPQQAPAKPSGGLTADTQARQSLSELIDRLVAAGILTP
jgi:hypothetical protein